MTNRVQDAVMGLCVGDALGVPVEFMTRGQLLSNPVKDMRAFGIHRQLAGTWSDDTSLTLCTLDSLAGGFNDYDMMGRFRLWLEKGEYSARGGVFDVGIATRNAITRFAVGKAPFECGCTSEYDNGNGSLMRILPLLFFIESIYGPDQMLCEEPLKLIHNVSALTHAHPRSQMACGIYLSVASELSKKVDILESVTRGIQNAIGVYGQLEEFQSELVHFERLNLPSFSELPIEDINSSGYVIDTLEAALWCILTTMAYSDCVLKAVNLGGDTDTISAVAGGIAGIYYGGESIPSEWIDKIANKELIQRTCENFLESVKV